MLRGKSCVCPEKKWRERAGHVSSLSSLHTLSWACYSNSFAYTSQCLFHCPDPGDTAAFKGWDQECSCTCVASLLLLSCSRCNSHQPPLDPPLPSWGTYISCQPLWPGPVSQEERATRGVKISQVLLEGSPTHLSLSLFTNDQFWVCSCPDGRYSGIYSSADDLSSRHTSLCVLLPSCSPHVHNIPGIESEFCGRKDKTPKVPSLILALPTPC